MTSLIASAKYWGAGVGAGAGALCVWAMMVPFPQASAIHLPLTSACAMALTLAGTALSLIAQPLRLPDLAALASNTGPPLIALHSISVACALTAAMALSRPVMALAATGAPFLALAFDSGAGPSLLPAIVGIRGSASCFPRSPPSSARSLAKALGLTMAVLLAALMAATADALRVRVFATSGGILLVSSLAAGIVHRGAISTVADAYGHSRAPHESLMAVSVLGSGPVFALAALVAGDLPPLASFSAYAWSLVVSAAVALAVAAWAWAFFLPRYGEFQGSLARSWAFMAILLGQAWWGGGWATGSGTMTEAHAFRSLVLASVAVVGVSLWVWRNAPLPLK